MRGSENTSVSVSTFQNMEQRHHQTIRKLETTERRLRQALTEIAALKTTLGDAKEIAQRSLIGHVVMCACGKPGCPELTSHV
jgi:hypothetical protein